MTILLFTLGSAAETSGYDRKCSVIIKGGELTPFENCAVMKADGAIVSPVVLKKVQFNKDGLAELRLHQIGCYWMNRRGESKKTLCFDNGSDYFVDGVARYIAPSGKYGFMDKNLKVVIPASFDFVFPFINGRARFCQGCRESRKGEYTSMTGGTWGSMDRKGSKRID